ncbi:MULTISPECIES: DUF3226 domain-containing protein [unclassified Flavobacterium]|uniref:DUF3226 domain-containing protein n=1 Tax=unclassified Flavobacterium TaxID=196869 RepID=UPI00156EC92E|nr:MULTISPECIES: DUF3226 domain-containing protein [unclassified Flavobacterium]MBE0390262.1 hypothetical protein [Flavobacterium sp. PL002]NRT16247.1 hypothetical protein [Flavobacterium sp. 28A]
MDLPIRIFCEGVSDQRFLRDFLKVHYDIAISDKELNDNKPIHNLGSWNKLKIQKPQITEILSEFTSLIFLDADDDKVIEKPGFEATIKFVKDLMTAWNWTKYDIFVLPNHQDTGTIENLLENVINKKHSQIFECWNDFENCLSKDNTLTIPAKKSKIYSYLECLNQKDNCSDRNRDFQDEDLWDIRDLENPYILKLKTFLDKHLI